MDVGLNAYARHDTPPSPQSLVRAEPQPIHEAVREALAVASGAVPRGARGDHGRPWAGGANCQRYLDIYEDRVSRSCDPVRTGLTPLGWAFEDVARPAEHFTRPNRTQGRDGRTSGAGRCRRERMAPVSAPWGSALRLAHGLHRRLSAEWQRICVHEGCVAAPAGRRVQDGHCLRHLPNREARKAALESMLRVLTVTPTGAHTVVDLRGTTFDELLLNETFGLVHHSQPDEDAPALSWSLRKCVFTGRANFAAKVFGGLTRRMITSTSPTSASRTRRCSPARASTGGRSSWTRDSTPPQASTRPSDTWFLRTRFDGTASFNDTAFAASAYFHDVAASTGMAFTGATFSGAAHLDPITTPSLDLAQAVFAQRATVHVAGSCVADHARFDDGVAVRLLHRSAAVSTLSLTGVRLGAPSTVTGDIPRVDHDPAVTTTSDADHGGDLPWLLSPADADVAELTVTDVDLAQCLFAGAINLDKLRLGGTTPFARPTRHRLKRGQQDKPSAEQRARWRRCWTSVRRWCSRSDRPVGREMLVEELVARLGPTAALGTDRDSRGPAGRHVTNDQLAVLYRSLRKAREDAKDEPGAADLYLGEMEARRRGTRKIAERLTLAAYRALSGYGLRAGRALAWLLGLVAILTVLLVGVGLPDTSGPGHRMTGTLQPERAAGAAREIDIEVHTPPSLLPPADRRLTLDRVERAARVATGSVLFRDTDQQLTTAGRWTVNSGRLLGPLLIALAALAVRARVKR